MKFLQSAIFFTLLFFTFSAFAQTETAVSRTWEVQKYDITATLPTTEADRFLTAKAILTLKNVSGSAASRLTLRISEKAEIADIKVNNSDVPVTKSQEKISPTRNLQRAAVSVPIVQPNQILTVEVNYKLKVDENSGLNAISPVGGQFLPLSFWYPTPNSWFFTRGADFAPFKIQINTANGTTAISSGTNTANSFETKSFGQPFFATGNWDKINANGVEVYLPKGANADAQKRAGELAALASEAKTYAAGILGTSPVEPLRLISVERGSGFSGGGTMLVDENLFRRQKIDAQTAETVAESVIKMWIGNSIHIDGDGSGIIREGLTRFIATQFIEQKYGKDIADIERLRQRTAYAAIVKRDAPLNIVSPLDDYYYSEVANKGAMIWRLLAAKLGQEEFFNIIRTNSKDNVLTLGELREAFAAQKDFLDYAFDQVTDMNLRVGLPQVNGGEAKLALSNTGSVDATVNIVVTMANGEKMSAQSTIKAKSFGEVIFKTTNKIVRAEVDADKLYPQVEYSDDVAPREFDDGDVLLAVKRSFDKQEFANAEKNARIVLNLMPRFDDVRILLARALLAQGKNTEAEKEFRAVLDEKLPTARSLAWANIGLGDINIKSGQKVQAGAFYNEAVKADAESLIARQGRNNANIATPIDESIKTFFAQFDKAAVSGNKSALDSMIVSGEITRFAGGIAGQAQEWTSKVVQFDQLDANTALVEVELNIRLINKSAESGMAVFRLVKIGNNWKLSGVKMFEVR
ncbi:hypothetical protein BH10ACI1_BH10ACI1_23960 [soil metagenome]